VPEDPPRRPGTDTNDAMTSARTVRSASDSHRPSTIESADTQMAAPPGPAAPPREPLEMLSDRYQLLEVLGRGAEGAVYRAWDLKAQAIVAIKLFERDASSEVRLQRFRRELQLARKVTHPNVVRIHDLVELPGRFGLSMELVEGEPLDARIAREGKLEPGALEALALDLARALAAAHEAGVTHRDLKPANVLLRAGTARAIVTDFGVSRLHGTMEDGSTRIVSGEPVMRLTSEGALIGTPLYMAPEQLQGRTDIGPAADVYAFGLLIFEAATGERLNSEAATIGELRRARIVQPAPALRERRPDLPKGLCDVVDRCLAREAADRYPDGAALLRAFEPPAAQLASRARILPLAAAGAALALAVTIALARPGGQAGGVATAADPGPATPPLAFHPLHMRRITFADGCEEFPQFTPDGRSLVYDGSFGADSFIAVQPVDGGTPRRLTLVHGWDFAPAVSPAGDRVAFVRATQNDSATWIADLDGKTPPRRLSDGSARPSWAPDGRSVWAGDRMHPTLVDVDTGKTLRSLVAPDGFATAQSVDLGQGRLLVNFPEFGNLRIGGIGTYDESGEVTWLLQGDIDEALAVTPDRRHALTVRRRPIGDPELVDVPLDGSPVSSLLASGVVAWKGIAFSPDGRKVAWSTCRGISTLARVDGGGNLVTLDPHAEWSDTGVAWIPGTDSILALSSRGGGHSAWVIDRSGKEQPREIPLGELDAFDVAVSPDGRTAAFAIKKGGIYLGSLSGDVGLHPITRGAEDVQPAFRVDAPELLFTRELPEGTRVLAVPLAGGDPRPFLDAVADAPAPSPVDGRVLVLVHEGDRTVPQVFDPRTGRRTPLSARLAPGKYGQPRFSPDGRRVTMLEGAGLVEVDAKSGAVLQRVDAQGDQLFNPTYTRSELLVIRGMWVGDLWMGDDPL
jgi:Tol biopolymer transport system component/tRNA A-37 threonylcarbamoyl transferase component Bud32